jgi:hypothetical protein
MEMQGLKPSVLMGKLKQNFPPGASPDNDLFLAMFLIRLPASMRETVGAGDHRTAAAVLSYLLSRLLPHWAIFTPEEQ